MRKGRRCQTGSERSALVMRSCAGPIFVHCRTGKRSGALAVMDKAIRDSMTGLQAVKKVHILGSPCDASLEKLIRNYVDSRRNQT